MNQNDGQALASCFESEVALSYLTNLQLHCLDQGGARPGAVLRSARAPLSNQRRNVTPALSLTTENSRKLGSGSSRRIFAILSRANTSSANAARMDCRMNAVTSTASVAKSRETTK